MEYTDLDTTASFGALTAAKPVSLRSVLDRRRIEALRIDAGGGFVYSYAAKQVDESILAALAQLAEEQALVEKYRRLASGEFMNTGEGRMVLHHHLRGVLTTEVVHDGVNLRRFYRDEQARVADFARKVRSGTITGSTNKPFSRIVQIGIGGSDLGPRALYLALLGLARPGDLGADFISNVDPDDAAGVLAACDPETTLFILVSKSGTTQETLTNERLVREWLSGVPGVDPSRHMVAVTSQTSPLAGSDAYLDAFFIDDFIGGRYSGTSAVGGVVLSLAFGPEVFAEVLEGAHEADRKAMEPMLGNNAAMTDALIGVYERNVLGYPVTAVLPYSQALVRFPAHLQQLDMESNGKQVNRDGRPIGYATGPVVFGEPGTNGQHSFYQLLHQGTDVVPLQFIGFADCQRGMDVTVEGSTSQAKLNANLAAQIVAFALGSGNRNLNRNFPGERPSSLLVAPRLTPRALGALLAHFENKVMFQGFAWNLNSFDQEGVQLGKVLTKKVLAGGDLDPILAAYTGLLGLGL